MTITPVRANFAASCPASGTMETVPSFTFATSRLTATVLVSEALAVSVTEPSPLMNNPSAAVFCVSRPMTFRTSANQS